MMYICEECNKWFDSPEWESFRIEDTDADEYGREYTFINTGTTPRCPFCKEPNPKLIENED